MSYSEFRADGFGRVFVDSVAGFELAAWALSALPCAPLVLNWIQIGGNARRGRHTVHDRARYGAEFFFNTNNDLAALIASNLARVSSVSFDITSPCQVDDLGHRYAFTPQLGLFHAQLDHAGNMVFTEQQVQRALNEAKQNAGGDVESMLAKAMGVPWDLALNAEHALLECALETQRIAS